MNKKISQIFLFFLIMTILSSCGKVQKKETQQTSSSNTSKTVVDMAGRKVTVPTDIKKAYSTSMIGNIAIYTLAPDKLSGWTNPFTKEAKAFILDKYQNLPVLGWSSSKSGTSNNEEVLKAHPDVIISMGIVDSSYIQEADNIQKQMDIPVVLVDSSIDKMDEAYVFLGDLLGDKKRGKELADYCKKTVSDIKTEVAKVPKDKQVKVYYAEGAKGLNTDPKGSLHTEVIDLIGGINVANVKAQGGTGRSAVSMEQVLNWNPDIILVCPDDSSGSGTATSFYSNILSDSNWGSIKAVKDKNVYEIPILPFNWLDRPPSVNRIIGIKWLANLLYPDYVKLDIDTEVKDFYKKFYQKQLSDKEVKDLLKNGERK